MSAGVEGSVKESIKQSAVFLTILAGSLAVNVFLGLSAVGSAPRSQEPSVLEVGADAPAIAGQDLDGTDVEVDYAAKDRTIVYSVSSTCVWCQRNEGNLSLIARRTIDSAQLVLIAQNDPGFASYLTSWKAAHPGVRPIVLTRVAPESHKALGLGGTPHTLVIDRFGKVVANWRGAFQGETREQASRMFGIDLVDANNTEVERGCSDSNGRFFTQGWVVTRPDGTRSQCGPNGRWQSLPPPR